MRIESVRVAILYYEHKTKEEGFALLFGFEEEYTMKYPSNPQGFENTCTRVYPETVIATISFYLIGVS